MERSVALIDAALAGCSFSVQNCSLECDLNDLVGHRHLSVKGSQLGAQNNSCYLGLIVKIICYFVVFVSYSFIQDNNQIGNISLSHSFF